MPRVRTARGGRSRGFRPASDWGAVTIVDGLVDPTVVGNECDIWPLYNGTDAAAPDRLVANMTWLRVRGCLYVRGNNLQAGRPGTTHMAWGIGLADAKSVVAGAASLECPMLDASEDLWLAWGCTQLQASDAQWEQLTADRLVIDSKAMRRIEDKTVYLAVEVASTDVGPSVSYGFDLRYLLQPSSK